MTKKQWNYECLAKQEATLAMAMWAQVAAVRTIAVLSVALSEELGARRDPVRGGKAVTEEMVAVGEAAAAASVDLAAG